MLSIEIEGPTRPQLTLVDLPGLIQTETKGVTKEDVDMVKEITHHYVSQPRTICLAVISATNDYANQSILTKVREVDPEGERTLGIITKPDRLPSGSGSEQAFLNLAQNEDVFFKLGWVSSCYLTSFALLILILVACSEEPCFRGELHFLYGPQSI